MNKTPSLTVTLPNISSREVCSKKKFDEKNLGEIFDNLFKKFHSAQYIFISVTKNFNHHSRKLDFEKNIPKNLDSMYLDFIAYKASRDKRKRLAEIKNELDLEWKQFRKDVCGLCDRYWRIVDDIESGKKDTDATRGRIVQWILSVDFFSLCYFHLKRFNEMYQTSIKELNKDKK